MMGCAVEWRLGCLSGKGQRFRIDCWPTAGEGDEDTAYHAGKDSSHEFSYLNCGRRFDVMIEPLAGPLHPNESQTD